MYTLLEKHGSIQQVKAKIYQGTIVRWLECGNSSFGFIEYNVGDSRVDSVYFSRRDMITDNVGRTHPTIGSLVQFRISKQEHRGQLRPFAVDVVPDFQSNVDDPRAYRETGIVDSLFPGYVFLLRPSNDYLFLHNSDVEPTFRDLFKTIRQGSRVWYGVAEKGGRWRAVHAEIYEEES